MQTTTQTVSLPPSKKMDDGCRREDICCAIPGAASLGAMLGLGLSMALFISRSLILDRSFYSASPEDGYILLGAMVAGAGAGAIAGGVGCGVYWCQLWRQDRDRKKLSSQEHPSIAMQPV